MRASSVNINKSIHEIKIFLVKYISKSYGVTEVEAVNRLIRTSTYQLLQDKSSKLYAESPEYVLDMLLSEIKGNIVEWLEL